MNLLNAGKTKELFQMLLLASLCCGMLLAARLLFKWHFLPGVDTWQEFVEAKGAVYIFLTWNLFLAWLPYLFSLQFSASRQRGAGILPQILLLGLWLIFLPNAPYIITDFLHFRYKPPVPVWFDLILLFAFASTGLMLGLLSIHTVQESLRKTLPRNTVRAIVLASIALSGFGIWLGRFQRWNSWDLFTRPGALISDLADTLGNEHEWMRALAITALLSGIVWVGFGFLNVLMHKPRTDFE